MVGSYPVQFDVDFPARPLDRFTTVFRIFAAIPILLLIGLLTGATLRDSDHSTTYTLAGGGIAIFLPLVLMILFRQKYSRWWFEWNLNVLRFSNRVTAYLALLDDRYPSSDEEQAVHLNFAYPDVRRMNRWLPLIKWFLAIPHYVVLFFLGNRRRGRGHRCLVCHSLHGDLSTNAVRLRRWRHPMGQPSQRLGFRAGHG
jgi:hypothetical protein